MNHDLSRPEHVQRVPTVEYRCRDECGTAAQVDVTLPGPPGWYFLEITKTWRCPACARALQAVA